MNLSLETLVMSAPVVAIVVASAVAGFVVLIIPVIMNIVDLAPYMYTNAKIRALEAGLLKKPKLEDLKNAKTRLDCISSLEETDYGTYINKEADPSSEEGLERALNQHTADIYNKLVKTVPKEVTGVMRDLLKVYDVRNIKMVFRSLKNDEFPAEKRTELVTPIGTMKPHILKALVESKTLDEAVSELESTEYGKVVSVSMPKVEETNSLLPLEIALDKYVYENAHKKIALSKESNMVSVGILLGTKIDITNLKTLLRIRGANSKVDNIDDFLINASYNLKGDKIKSLAKADAVEDILSQLEGTPYAEAVSDVVTTFKDTGSLYQIEKKLDEYYEKSAKQISVKYGLGIGPALNMLVGKEADARKIRVLSSFSTEGIDIETGGAV